MSHVQILYCFLIYHFDFTQFCIIEVLMEHLLHPPSTIQKWKHSLVNSPHLSFSSAGSFTVSHLRAFSVTINDFFIVGPQCGHCFLEVYRANHQWTSGLHHTTAIPTLHHSSYYLHSAASIFSTTAATVPTPLLYTVAIRTVDEVGE